RLLLQPEAHSPALLRRQLPLERELVDRRIAEVEESRRTRATDATDARLLIGELRERRAHVLIREVRERIQLRRQLPVVGHAGRALELRRRRQAVAVADTRDWRTCGVRLRLGDL